jgi:hypothetical protein
MHTSLGAVRREFTQQISHSLFQRHVTFVQPPPKDIYRFRIGGINDHQVVK